MEDFPAGYKVRATGTRIYTLQLALNLVMLDGRERTPQEMMDDLEKEDVHLSKPSLHKAITALIQLGALSKTRRGRYKSTC